MNETKNIIDSLKAMGARPTVTRDDDENDIIQVNAPRLDPVETLFDSDLAEYEYMKEKGGQK